MQISQKHVGLIIVTVGMVGMIWILWPILRAEDSASSFAVDEVRDACAVLSVYDGDTFACDLNKNDVIDKPEEQIRMLGIDTPEMHYSRKNKTHGSKNPTNEPWAKEASQTLTTLVEHKTVYLEYDLERHDPYGRTMAYVYLTADAQASIGEMLLTKGYARTLFLGENKKRAKRYYEAEEQARLQKHGLWSAKK